MAEVQDIDVLILGAGINGAGLFRDLCAQGLACVIADKGDFGGGTSAAPSRLIHGGIKYLETGELRLVAQSTLERNLLLKNAPHLVRPLPTVIPIFSWLKGIGAALRTLAGSTTAPRARGALLMKTGLMLYDFYGARHRVMPRHRMWSRRRALAEIPPLTPRITAAGHYYDASVSQPERLVWELIADGLALAPQSRALNHTTFARDAGVVMLHGWAGTQAVRPRIVINAAGPWIDRVNGDLGAPSHLIGGTKGSHILLDHPALLDALKGRMIYFEADDGRICLVFDYLGRALVGSTDSRADDPDTVRCDDAEIDYFLAALTALLPGLRFGRDQIVYAYSGIRPLPASDGVAPGLISRDHSAPVSAPEGDRPWPIISLVGGKWTTFRGFAEEVADEILTRLARTRRVSTREMAIGGGRDLPCDAARADWLAGIAAQSGASPARLARLVERYGATARQITMAEGPAPRLLADAPDYSLEEFLWIATHEQVVHLADLVMRRSPIAVTGQLSARDLETIAKAVAPILHWPPARMAREYQKTATLLTTRHHARLKTA
ncbi:MAG: glycerol-3-phosphate dehydrogenase/oxidase [Paracoccus sp. (in: a-proteobacteria)]|nr:glycerol-3-phosphate dehydrogenase/oxidase [Paracoccus sp. (in: a-proteobacteria)]